MELITVLLSSFLSVLSFGGIVADQAAESAIRSRLNRADSIQVRIDNAPNLQILAGKADRVRVAAKGLWLDTDVRIAGFEMETDPIQIDPQKLQQDISVLSLEALPKPLQAGIKFAVTEEDINRSLRSATVLNRLQQVISAAITAFGGSVGTVYQIEQPQVRFLANGRLGMKFTLVDTAKPADKLDLDMESGIKIIGGRKIQLVDAQGTINRVPLPDFVLAIITSNVNERADLAVLESRGVTARVLNMNVTDRQLEIATFVRFQLPPPQQPR